MTIDDQTEQSLNGGHDFTWFYDICSKTEQLEQEMHAIAEQQEAHFFNIFQPCFGMVKLGDIMGYTLW